MTRHRWGNPLRTDHKTERQCTRCGMVKASRHESQGGKDIYWTEFYSGLDRIEGGWTPVCEPVGEVAV